MKDRQPTKVLANGAIRYGIYNADGSLNHYEYMKREDAPTVEGTPLNKANLLSDATAAKIWPNATTRPEDPTVNDALGKLSEGTAIVGDIAITARTDLSDAWLPCDGRVITSAQYPELWEQLRSVDTPLQWDTVTLPYTSTSWSHLSYADGYWFYTCSPDNKARMWYSQDLLSWTECSVTLSSGQYLYSLYPMRHYNGTYMCIGSGSFGRCIVYSSDLSSNWSTVTLPTDWEPLESDILYDGLYYLILDSTSRVHYTTSFVSGSWYVTDPIYVVRSAPVVRSWTWDESTHTLYWCQDEYNSSGNATSTSYGIFVELTNVATRQYRAQRINWIRQIQYINGIMLATNRNEGSDYADVTSLVTIDLKTLSISSTVTLPTAMYVKNLRLDGIYKAGNYIFICSDAATLYTTKSIQNPDWATISIPGAPGSEFASSSTQAALAIYQSGKAIVHDFSQGNKVLPTIQVSDDTTAYIKALEE